MKRIYFIAVLIFSLALAVFADEVEYGGIGAVLRKDGNKTFVIKVFPDSPASKANLAECSEVLSVDNKKTKKMTLNEVTNSIRGQVGTSVKLLVKIDGKKEEVAIARGKVNPPTNKDERYNIHWQQVAPQGYSSMGYFYNNKHYSSALQSYINHLNYWAKREDSFKTGYNACLTYSKNDQNTCLMNLVNRELQKTENDRQTELQQEAIRQQATQNFINTMNQIQTNTNLNNINNSIQQQNLQLQNTNMQLQNTNMQLYNINNSLNRW